MDYNKFIKILNKLDSNVPIYVCGHMVADYDSAGSTLALCYLLDKFGKKVIPLIESKDKDKLSLLNNIYNFNDNVDDSRYNFIIVDANKLSRIPSVFQPFYKKALIKLNIDHHEGIIEDADYIFSISELSSTAEIIYELFLCSGVTITKEIATLLFSAIVTDTKCFYNRTTYRTFEIASSLIKAGADNTMLIKKLHINRTNNEIKLIKEMLDEIKYDGIHYLVLNLKNRDVDYNSITKKCIPFILSNENIDVLCVYIILDNMNRCECRSNNGLNVAEIANIFGGGGHKNASGFSTKKSVKEVVNIINSYIKKINEDNNE